MNGITPILLECLAGLYVPALEPTAEPADTLLGRAVREAIGRHARAGHPLDTVVANRRRRVQPFLEVTRLEFDLPERGASGLRGFVPPHAGKAISLQLQPHRERILLIRSRLLHLADL